MASSMLWSKNPNSISDWIDEIAKLVAIHISDSSAIGQPKIAVEFIFHDNEYQ